MCTPPFVSTGPGSNVAPVLTKAVRGVFMGVAIGEEMNAFKKKSEFRRFVIADIQGTQCFMPFDKVAAPKNKDDVELFNFDATFTKSKCEEACRAAVSRKPGSVHSAYAYACSKQNAIIIDLVPGASAENGGRYATRNGGVAPPGIPWANSGSGAALPPGGSDAGSNAGAATAKSTTSGVAKGLAGMGEISLERFSEGELLLALTENKLSQPPADEADKSGWAKQQLLR
eukprot:142384-Pleurochrysis_carterae.AAC.1